MDDGLRAAAHTAYRINYHFLFAPKSRRAILEGGVADAFRDVLACLAGRYGFEVVECMVAPAYVHLFVSASPRWAPSTLMAKIKGITATELFRQYPGLRAVCPGGLWKRGYYVATSGDRLTDELIAYHVGRF
jgi:putative transposase